MKKAFLHMLTSKVSNLTFCLKNYLERTFINPKEPKSVSVWQVRLLWLLRIILFYNALYQLGFGDLLMGILTFITFIALTAPGLLTKNQIKNIPIEIEIMLSIIAFIQFVLGETRDLYYTTPFFDKFVHVSASFFVATIAYIIVYTMYVSGKLVASKGVMMFLVLLVTIGIGGLWEVFEYGIELLRLNYFPDWVQYQGSLVENPYFDTMNDLVADTLGGILGALFALKYFLNKSDNRTRELLKELRKELFS